MVTNLTNLTGAKPFYDIIVFTNQVTNDIMGVGFIITTFVILLMMFLRNDLPIEKALLGSSFLCFLFSILLSAINLLASTFIIGFAVITVLTGFWSFYSKG